MTRFLRQNNNGSERFRILSTGFPEAEHTRAWSAHAFISTHRKTEENLPESAFLNLFGCFIFFFLHQIFEVDESLPSGFFDDADSEEYDEEDEFNSSQERAEFLTRAVLKS